mmetsp:Transcript_77951/g.240658  ORF Transcript_77951/g.240658 Transcript_77951/m.240658 type:complete len:294 (-) Transcript_77951:487-1368(-)
MVLEELQRAPAVHVLVDKLPELLPRLHLGHLGTPPQQPRLDALRVAAVPLLLFPAQHERPQHLSVPTVERDRQQLPFRLRLTRAEHAASESLDDAAHAAPALEHLREALALLASAVSLFELECPGRLAHLRVRRQSLLVEAPGNDEHLAHALALEGHRVAVVVVRLLADHGEAEVGAAPDAHHALLLQLHLGSSEVDDVQAVSVEALADDDLSREVDPPLAVEAEPRPELLAEAGEELVVHDPRGGLVVEVLLDQLLEPLPLRGMSPEDGEDPVVLDLPSAANGACDDRRRPL